MVDAWIVACDPARKVNNLESPKPVYPTWILEIFPLPSYCWTTYLLPQNSFYATHM